MIAFNFHGRQIFYPDPSVIESIDSYAIDGYTKITAKRSGLDSIVQGDPEKVYNDVQRASRDTSRRTRKALYWQDSGRGWG